MLICKSTAHVCIRFIIYPRRVEQFAKALGIINYFLILAQEKGYPACQSQLSGFSLQTNRCVGDRLTLRTARCSEWSVETGVRYGGIGIIERCYIVPDSPTLTPRNSASSVAPLQSRQQLTWMRATIPRENHLPHPVEVKVQEQVLTQSRFTAKLSKIWIISILDLHRTSKLRTVKFNHSQSDSVSGDKVWIFNVCPSPEAINKAMESPCQLELFRTTWPLDGRSSACCQQSLLPQHTDKVSSCSGC